MSTAIFVAEKGIFHFDLQDVFASLQDHTIGDRDAADLVSILKSSSSEARIIPSEKGFFGYIVVDETIWVLTLSAFLFTGKKSLPLTSPPFFPIIPIGFVSPFSLPGGRE